MLSLNEPKGQTGGNIHAPESFVGIHESYPLVTGDYRMVNSSAISVLDLDDHDPDGLDRKRRRRCRGTNAYLTFLQKIQIINKKRENPGFSQQQLAEWAKEEFGMQAAVTQGTISNILKNSSKILSTAPVDMNTKRKRKLSNEVLDNALAHWVYDMESSGKKLTGDLIISKARDLSAKIKERDNTATFPDFSAGWLGSFKDRHGIRLNKIAAKPQMPFNDVMGPPMIGQFYPTHISESNFSLGDDPSSLRAIMPSKDRDLNIGSIEDEDDEDDLNHNPPEFHPNFPFGPDKSDDDYIEHACRDSSWLAMIRSTNTYRTVKDTSTTGSAPLSIADKQKIVQQAIEILNDFRIPTKELRTAQYLLGSS